MFNTVNQVIAHPQLYYNAVGSVDIVAKDQVQAVKNVIIR